MTHKIETFSNRAWRATAKHSCVVTSKRGQALAYGTSTAAAIRNATARAKARGIV